jgi:hypothetical protein
MVQPAPAQPVRVDFEVAGTTTGGGAPGSDVVVEETPAERAQPPEVKLKLGHYRSRRTGVALVIDRLDEHVAKIRFDHTERVERLEARYFWFRTEYHRGDQKVLEFQNDGSIALYMSSQEIWLFRDGDADPL